MSSVTFTGLASGLDTSALIEAMLTNYQSKYDTEYKEQLLLELKLDKYKEVNALVLDFYDNQLRDLRMQSTFMQSNTTVSDDSVVSIIGGGNDNDYIEILQTAQSAAVSTSSITNNVTSATALDQIGIEEDTSITVTTYDSSGVGTETTIDLTADMSISDVVDKFSELGIDASYNDFTQQFSLDFSGQIGLSGDLAALGISTTGTSTQGTDANGDDIYIYTDQVATNALTKTTTITGDTALGTLGISAGTVNINGEEIRYDGSMTIDDIIQKFADIGVDVEFIYSDDNTSGYFEFDVSDGFTIGGDCAPFIDTTVLVDDGNDNYTFDTTITADALIVGGTSTSDSDSTTEVNNIKLSDLGISNGYIALSNGSYLVIDEDSTIQSVLNLLETTGDAVSFNSETMSFEIGDTDIQLSGNSVIWEQLGITQGNGIESSSIEIGNNTALSVFGIDSGTITIDGIDLDLAGASINDVIEHFYEVAGIKAIFNNETNTFEFDIAEGTSASISGDLQSLGIDATAINLQPTVSSSTLTVADPTDVDGNTTLFELGYDTSMGLSVNGDSIDISSSMTVNELVEALNDAGVNVKFNKDTQELDFDLSGGLALSGDLASLGVDLSDPNAVQTDTNTYTFTDEVPVVELERVSAAEYTTSTTLEELGFKWDGNGDAVTITVNGTEVSFAPDSTIQDLLDQFTELGITAAFDSKVGAFQFTNSSGNIEFTGDNVDQLHNLGIEPNDDGSYIFENQQAIAKYNGMTVYSDTNTFELEGITFAAKSVGEAFVSVTADLDAIYESISDFVDAYNSLIEELNTLVNADYNSDYLPLTSEEMADMSDYEIELWNEKVESSLLRNDSTLQSLLTGMRYAFMDYYPGQSPSCLMEIGITTSVDYTENGKLYIDEDKLMDALTNNLEGVMDLFTGNEEKGMTGLAETAYQKINDMMSSSEGSSAMFLFNDKDLETAISYQEEQVEKALARMEAQESIYTAKFLAMELMIQKLNISASLFETST